MEPLQKLKRDSVETFLAYGLAVLAFDSHTEGVVLPPDFQNSGGVVLHIGHNLPNPIPDLVLSDEGVTATLSFEREPFKVFVPWEAVTNTGLMGTGCTCFFPRTTADFTAGEVGSEDAPPAPEPAPAPEGEPEPAPAPEPEPEGKVIPFKLLDGGKE